MDYHRAVAGQVFLLPDAEQREELRLDYHAMESEGLFDGDSLTFDDLMEEVGRIENEINRDAG